MGEAMLERAIEIAVSAHRGQLDKAVEPYILHPLRVMLAMDDTPGRIAAVLHDVVEDSRDWRLSDLRAEGFGEDVCSAVDAVTRRSGETYETFIARAALDQVGRRVKVADLLDNLDPARVAKLPPDPARLDRYNRALAYLRQITPPAPAV